MFAQENGQSNGFEAQVVAHGLIHHCAVVTFAEKEIDGLVDRLEPTGYFGAAGDFDDVARAAEESACAAEPFFDGFGAGQQRVSDLGDAESAQRLQNHRNLSLG